MENFDFDVLTEDAIDINGTVIKLRDVPDDKLNSMLNRYKRKSESDEDWICEGYYTAAYETILRVVNYRKDHPNQGRTPEDLLEIARETEVGDTITCPNCKNEFEKRNSQHLFCSNGRTKQGGNCKDRYWNLHDPKRRERLDNYHEENYAE
ncbi:MAG: hypothetical protein CMF61_03315 [Magnetococcales bacterium]|nr:hypothetical protein [Magnetococcales bacterium]